MKTLYHSAQSRGHADYGWLNTYHNFSFAQYFNPERTNFGALRVLNDDEVLGGMGFAKHPHHNMEIISIPLSGALKHGDNMGNEGVISKGEVQLMSAGRGVMHSEKNAHPEKKVNFLQIWVYPEEKDITPSYDQVKILPSETKNNFHQIVSPDGQGARIHQQAWFSMAHFEQNCSKSYTLKRSGNGVYVFVIEGSIKIGEQMLNKRDAMGIWEVKDLTITAIDESEFLLMDIPMELPNFAS